MAVPYTFATATSAIPLSQLDSNFATAITLGSTALTLGTTTTSVSGLTLSSPTFTTPALGTPASGVLTNCTGYPSSAISGTISLTTQVTGTLPVANGGTGVTTSTGTGNVVLSTSPTLVTPVLGTPTSVTLTNGTGLPISTGVSGLGTGVATFLATPTSANLASAVSDETGSGALVFATSPTLVTPVLGTPTSVTLTNGTGLPISTGVSGLGTGVATALAVNTGSSGAVVLFGGALGTPSSGTLTNATGLPISTGVSGLGTGVATFLATPSSANLASAVTDETGSGLLVFATTPTLTNPTVTNYVETLYAPAAGSAFTISLANGTIQEISLNANGTITLPSSVAGKSYTIIVTYSGAYTLTWAGGGTLKWAGGTAPTATSVSGKYDIFNFYCDGTNTYGSTFGLNY